jgi:hypothetical protein
MIYEEIILAFKAKLISKKEAKELTKEYFESVGLIKVKK